MTWRAPSARRYVEEVKNERWDGVPFIIKAGKALNEGKCEIRVQLRDVPGDLFAHKRNGGKQARNEFVVRLQPDPAIYMKMTVKEPGLGMELAGSCRSRPPNHPIHHVVHPRVLR